MEMKIQKINDYQLEELKQNKLFINKYDLDLKYLYELNRYWKEFLFDLLCELSAKKIALSSDNLFDYLKNNYNQLIIAHDLSIDIRDYIEITDYISLDEWLKDENNRIAYSNLDIFLASEI